MIHFAKSCAFGAILALSGNAATVLAGDLTPPAGPIQPTMKTLAQIEPRIAVNAANTPGDADSVYRLAAPGSYYLIGNVTGVSGKHGVEIAASDVRLDLMGFEIVGVAGSLDGVNGASASPLSSGITVRNGTIRGWGDDGVDLSITVGGACSDLIATGNTATGIHAPIGATMANCTSRQNGAGGFIAGVVMRDCYASNNTGDGMLVGAGSILENCVSSVNTGNGFNAVGHTNFLNCAAGGNGLVGFVIANTGVANGCNASQNTGSGFSLDQAAMAVNCSATLNDGDGFTLGSHCTIRGCNARINEFDGIRASTGNHIIGNHCSANGNTGDGAGIHVTGADNTIRENDVIGNDRGIDVDAVGNFIVHNTASGNTGTGSPSANYDILFGNAYGAIVGFLGAYDTGNTAHWTNFSY